MQPQASYVFDRHALLNYIILITNIRLVLQPTAAWLYDILGLLLALVKSFATCSRIKDVHNIGLS